MVELREAFAANGPLYIMLGGLIIGFVFGYIVYRTNFCTMGSISDFMSFGDYRRFRAWILAGATAIVGTQLLVYFGILPLSNTMYISGSLNWLGNILGGFIFGFGMVFAGGCASKNLARAGGGDLRALVTLVIMGIFAYMSIGGVLGPARAAIESATAVPMAGIGASQGLADIASRAAGIAAPTAGLVVGLLIAGLMAAYCFGDSSFRSSPIQIVSGIGIGLCVVAGWAVTGLAFDELADVPMQPISLTYVRPTGDTLEWLQRFTALGLPNFGISSVFGAIVGAFIAAISMGRFRFTTYSDANDTIRNMFGAALMGIGGVMALGCTVGQAITGVSTLAIGSFVTFAAIVTGGIVGMKAFERVLMAEA
ncbi:MAG: hypothetical protein APF80_13105 [Alphaproteobacteria bacterium BRH_c36]|nr:MAG: hypothetical protein APF80_13105 [Alphaproteobacteria bacterium BRH_c36]